MRTRLKAPHPYLMNPAWHLISISKAMYAENQHLYEVRPAEKIQAEFLLTAQRAIGKKINLPNKNRLSEIFTECAEAVKSYGDISEIFKDEIQQAIERFQKGEPYRYPNKDKVESARARAVEAYQQFRSILKRSFSPKEFASLAKKLDLAPSLANSLFRYLITGSKKVDHMEILIIGRDTLQPRLLIAPNASRNDIDDGVGVAELEKLAVKLPESDKELIPFLYKHSDGLTYVAVDVLKRRLSEIRRLMPRIKRLQAKLPGFHLRSKRKKLNIERDIKTIEERKKGTQYRKISDALGDKFPLGSQDAEDLLRQAKHRITKSLR